MQPCGHKKRFIAIYSFVSRLASPGRPYCPFSCCLPFLVLFEVAIENPALDLFRRCWSLYPSIKVDHAEDAVKALNNLVRLCSGVDGDGTSLMETVFSPKKPILRFNDLQDQSDQDEQKGFMMMFSGAVAGLRNPRAHRLIKDDPERALEFIAFVSLLAKLLDGAKK
jgi:uncharacterized protein (TIGR02391 family)